MKVEPALAMTSEGDMHIRSRSGLKPIRVFAQVSPPSKAGLNNLCRFKGAMDCDSN